MNAEYGKNTSITDETLCARAASGDRAAEETLVLRYSRLVRVCARPFFLAGGDSEDLIQEGMLGLLSAIREFTEFGAGYRIAMRDLEIRGAGDLLGAEQSGHMMTVGYDMYLKLLEDAVLEERGEEAQKEPECTADLTVTANINKDYVSSGEQRMDLYRRMAAIRTKEDADELLDEIVDRFGDPPKGVMNLIAIALLRARAAAAGITEITQKDGAILLSLATMDFAAISACCAEAQFKGRIFFSAGKVPMLSVKLKKGEDALKLATQLVGTYAAMRAQTAEG